MAGQKFPATGRIKPNGKLEKIQQYIYAICWFLGVTESIAMCNTHAKADSVAIVFHANYLTKLILTQARQYENSYFTKLYHGKVNYINLLNGKSFSTKDQNTIGFIKDKSYKHEEEFRFLAVQSAKTKKLSEGLICQPGN